MNIIDGLVLGILIIAVVCVFIRLVRSPKASCHGCGDCPYRQKCTAQPSTDDIGAEITKLDA